MTKPKLILPPFVKIATHSQGEKACLVCTDVAVSTASLGGDHYVAVVINEVESPVGAVMFLNAQEAEAQIALLQLALDDVARLYAGKPALAALATATRQ